MRVWLSRLAFSFLIIGGVLLWHAHRASRGDLGPVPQSRIILYVVAGALSLAMGIAGLRERHRPGGPGNP